MSSECTTHKTDGTKRKSMTTKEENLQTAGNNLVIFGGDNALSDSDRLAVKYLARKRHLKNVWAQCSDGLTSAVIHHQEEKGIIMAYIRAVLHMETRHHLAALICW